MKELENREINHIQIFANFGQKIMRVLGTINLEKIVAPFLMGDALVFQQGCVI